MFSNNMSHLLFYIFCSLFVLAIAAPGDLRTISTPNGDVQGLEFETENNNIFYAFLGIRYGQAPIGNRRFRAPLPVLPWSGVYNATEPGNQCVQVSNTNNQEIFGEEDCLFVNVYTTQLPGGTIEPLPVLVWIHGGGFIYFSGDIGIDGADRFLDHGVILVSINYRLGIFGFLSTEDTVVPGNYGIKDQVLALKWVKKNIASFGGDPNQVTIFGESAGAASVNYLRQADPESLLFNRTIANSGNTLNPWTISRNAREKAFYVGVRNGIFTTNSQTLVNGLRLVNAVTLQQTAYQQNALQLTEIMNGLGYAPVLEEESEEAVYTERSYEAQQQGHFNRGDLLHGFNSLEGRVFSALTFPENLVLQQYNLIPSKLTPLDMNTNLIGTNIVGQNLKSFYFQNQSEAAVGPNFANYVSDNLFVRGIIRSSKYERDYSNVYLYRFSFTGGSRHSITPVEGVEHSEELQFLFGGASNVQITPEAQLTVERMVEMWTNFVKTGNPTPSVSVAVNVIWPLVNVAGDDHLHYLDIGYNLVPSVNPLENQMNLWDTQQYIYGHPRYETF